MQNITSGIEFPDNYCDMPTGRDTSIEQKSTTTLYVRVHKKHLIVPWPPIDKLVIYLPEKNWNEELTLSFS